MRALKSVDEAAELLRISKWTVRSYIKAGKLKPVRLGRRVLIEEAELERIVASGKTNARLEEGQLVVAEPEGGQP